MSTYKRKVKPESFLKTSVIVSSEPTRYTWLEYIAAQLVYIGNSMKDSDARQSLVFSASEKIRKAIKLTVYKMMPEETNASERKSKRKSDK